MPTNYLRRGPKPAPPQSHPGARNIAPSNRKLELTIAGYAVHIDLETTQSAERIYAALPLFSSAETWGDCIHFEIPIYGGRDRTARINAEIGGLYYWAEEERLILVFGPTPISGNGEIRLPRPCNVIGHTRDDLGPLREVHPGQKVSLKAI
jgi:uncharacterized protein